MKMFFFTPPESMLYGKILRDFISILLVLQKIGRKPKMEIPNLLTCCVKLFDLYPRVGSSPYMFRFVHIWEGQTR